jgi:hypothetical protein
MDTNEGEKKVKGTMLLDFARMIRGNKNIPWEKYLTKEDLEIVMGGVYAADWYPLETYRRCGLAAFKEIAHENLEIVRQFGRVSMKNMIENTYKMLGQCDDVFESFNKLNKINRIFANFAGPEFEKTGDNSVRMIVVGAEDEEGIEPMCYMAIGFADHIIERYGGKNIQIEWVKKIWAGDDGISLILTWE